MIVSHDTRPCTPRGHSAYRGYDATVGKVESLGLQRPWVRPVCEFCGNWFGSAESLVAHLAKKHGIGGAAA